MKDEQRRPGAPPPRTISTKVKGRAIKTEVVRKRPKPDADGVAIRTPEGDLELRRRRPE